MNVWISTLPALCGSFSCLCVPARVCWVAWPGALSRRFPTNTVFPLSLSRSLYLSCAGWFHPILGFASVVIYSLTRMSHDAGFYLFQEKIAESVYALWCWEPVLGARARKRAKDVPQKGFHSNNQGCLAACTVTDEKGQTCVRSIFLLKQQAPEALSSKPAPGHHTLSLGHRRV